MPYTVYLLDWYMYSTFRQSDCLIEVTTKNNSFGPQTRGLQPLNVGDQFWGFGKWPLVSGGWPPNTSSLNTGFTVS